MLSSVLYFLFIILFAALLIGVIRLSKGPSQVDRIIMFDLFTSIAIALMLISYLLFENPYMLDIGLLLSIISFVGSIGFAKYIENRTSENDS